MTRGARMAVGAAAVLLATAGVAGAAVDVDAAGVADRVRMVTLRAVDVLHAGAVALLGGREDGAARAERQEGDFSWSGSVEPGMTLEVKGVHGPIEAVPAEGDRAVVRARKQGRDSDPAEVVVEVVEHAGGVTVCAVYPSSDGRNECAPGDRGRNRVRNNDVQVAFRVEVPEGVVFRGATVSGDVTGRDLRSDVRASSVNGDVEVRTTGFVAASTVNGSIRAAMGRLDPDGLELQTVNGSIDLDVPDDAGADVDARWVNGGLETDLPFTLSGRLSRHRAEGTLGRGGPRLDLKTVNGSIQIR